MAELGRKSKITYFAVGFALATIIVSISAFLLAPVRYVQTSSPEDTNLPSENSPPELIQTQSWHYQFNIGDSLGHSRGEDWYYHVFYFGIKNGSVTFGYVSSTWFGSYVVMYYNWTYTENMTLAIKDLVFYNVSISESGTMTVDMLGRYWWG